MSRVGRKISSLTLSLAAPDVFNERRINAPEFRESDFFINSNKILNMNGTFETF